jgi:2-dehydropantoate 2-reductase
MARTRATLTTEGSALTASMLRDIERLAPIEADHIVGDLIRRGVGVVQRAPTFRCWVWLMRT